MSERQDEHKDWLSVAEAATYLGVSQPTVFRWMKQGKLTFFKVGGGTRFERRNLDAFVSKQTGSVEAQAVSACCAACGHHELLEGRLQGTGRLYFKPDKTKFWVFSDSMVGLRAHVCTACGFIQLHADVDKLDRLKPEESQ